MLALTLLVVASVAQQDGSKALYDQIVRTPDVRNGYEDYLRAADFARKSPYRAVIGWQPNMPAATMSDDPMFPSDREEVAYLNKIRQWTQLEAFRETSARFSKVVEAIRLGNSKKVWDPRPGADVGDVFPELAQFRNLAKVFRADAYVKFADGNSAGGTDSLLQGMTFAHKISGSTLISSLVGIAITAILCGEFSARLDSLSQKDCLQIARWSEAIVSEPAPMRQALEKEAELARSGLDLALSAKPGDASDDEEYSKLIEAIAKSTPQERARIRARAQAEIDRMKAVMQRRFDGPEKGWEMAEAEQLDPQQDPIVAALIETLAPVYSQAFGVAARQRTQFRLLGLHARIRAFRWENGRLPTTLSEAVGEASAQDPLSGEPFQYQITAGGYELFSKGSKSTGRVDLRYVRPVSGTKRDPSEPPAGRF